MLKADFHIHTKEDPQDKFIKYGAKELIDYAFKLKYNVLSITNHAIKNTDRSYYSKEVFDYAKRKGILLISGMEARIDNKDVLILNVPKKTKKPATFRRVEILKNEGALVIAPHPMYKIHSLNGEFVNRIELFDAIEYSHSYTAYFNPNKWGIEIAKKHKMPIVGTSDCHYIEQLDKTYTLMDSELKIDSVLECIRQNNVKLVTRPLTTKEYISILGRMMIKEKIVKAFSYREYSDMAGTQEL